jgi:hypothetical protein
LILRNCGRVFFAAIAGGRNEEDGALDFIETWFGLSPDRGDGSTEGLIILVVAIVALVGLATYIRARTRLRMKSEAERQRKVT